jgi:hypothetical protein
MYAPSQVTTPVQTEGVGQLVTDEEREKLQEIHELINCLLKELPAVARISAQPYAMLPLPTVPYTYSDLQMPWGGIPYMSSRVI